MTELRTIDAIPGIGSLASDVSSVGPAPQLSWLPIAALRVDPTYQRPITSHGRVNIAKIVADFRWNRFAPIVVSPIPGGLYAIVDGQHRATAAATLGFETVPAQIILADITEQAAAFSAINGAVTRVHGQALHKAAVAAGDPVACRVERIATAAGVKVLAYPVAELNQAPGETMAIGALRDALDTYGEEPVLVALTAVRHGQNDVRGGADGGHRPGGLCDYRDTAGAGAYAGRGQSLRRVGPPHSRSRQGAHGGEAEGKVDLGRVDRPTENRLGTQSYCRGGGVMVAYSFNPRFERPILSGEKSGTIRAVGRRRHARPGETVQLYVGQRTRHCRLLGEALCTSVDPIQIIISIGDGEWRSAGPTLDFIDIGREKAPNVFDSSISDWQKLDAFAQGDGFRDRDEMADFWWRTHRDLISHDQLQFNGVWIRWAPLGGPHDLG